MCPKSNTGLPAPVKCCLEDLCERERQICIRNEKDVSKINTYHRLDERLQTTSSGYKQNEESANEKEEQMINFHIIKN